MQSHQSSSSRLRATESPLMAAPPSPPSTSDRSAAAVAMHAALETYLLRGPIHGQHTGDARAAQQLAAQALRDLPRTRSAACAAIALDLAQRQRVSLVGRHASTPQELAMLAQIYRDPRFETFRVIFTDAAGTVVSQVGLTSRLPAASAALVGADGAAYLHGLAHIAKAEGATSFFLLHNHPSGDPLPSASDIRLTRYFMDSTLGKEMSFRGHVVIDTDCFGLIDRWCGCGIRPLPSKGQQSTPGLPAASAWEDLRLITPDEVAEFARQIQADPSAITLIVLDNQLKVRNITDVPSLAVKTDPATLLTRLRRIALASNGTRLIAVGTDRRTLESITPATSDCILVEGDGTLCRLGEVGDQNRILFPAERALRARVTPDTSAAFDYLRVSPLPALVEIDGVMRPTHNSKGQTIHPTFVGLRNFWRWFGDSDNVDAQGRPMVIFHGTTADNPGFCIHASGADGVRYSRAGIFAADEAWLASDYAINKPARDAADATRELQRHKNAHPGDFGSDYEALYERARQAIGACAALGAVGGNVMPLYMRGRMLRIDAHGAFFSQVMEEALEQATQQGFDGVIVHNVVDHASESSRRPATVRVTFDPENVKSATGNHGRFNPCDHLLVQEDAPNHSNERPTPVAC